MSDVPIVFVENVIKGDLFPEDGSPRRPDLAPGSAVWVDGLSETHVALDLVCPCGCGYVHSLNIRDATARSKDRPSWEWDGNVQKPTLSPSIAMRTPCGWHGFLLGGVFRSV